MAKRKAKSPAAVNREYDTASVAERQDALLALHTEIARLLTESMQAHLAAKSARRDKRHEATHLLRQARDLRLQAHALDPDHTAPAWIDEQQHTPNGRDTHDELMLFYQDKLGAPA